MRRHHPRGGLIIATRATWEKAMEEAIRRREVCLAKFGPAPHGWVFTVRRHPARFQRRNDHRWVLTFDHRKVRGLR